MNITVLGGGYLGERIASYLGGRLVSSRVHSIDDLKKNVSGTDVLINCAGKTGRPNVDWCEDHKDETFDANVILAELCAEFTEREGTRLVHFSSGCIYEGDNSGQGYSEDDQPNFEKSYYSYTKAEAERRLAKYNHVLTIRPRMPVAGEPSPRNLLNKLLAYPEVIVAPNSVTIIEDMLQSLRTLILSGHVGTFNMVNPTPVTHQDILELYEEISGKKLKKEYIDVSALRVKAPRSNTVLSAHKLATYGAPMPDTRESLHRIIRNYVNSTHDSYEPRD